MSVDHIVHDLSNLTLSDGIEDFLHAEHRANLHLPLKWLKSVACVTSPSLYNFKSCSGWSDCGTNWYGHEILRRNEMTLLARQLAQEINFTFRADAGLDEQGRGDNEYWPGRFRACHAETQLMAYIYYSRCQPSRPRTNSFDLHVFPRPVCGYCHDFATHVFLATGLQFRFYFDGQRDRPKCKHCKERIEAGYLCPNPDCAMARLLTLTESLNHAAAEWARYSKEFTKILKELEEEILRNCENPAAQQLAIVFKTLRRAITDLRQAMVGYAHTSKRVLQKIMSA